MEIRIAEKGAYKDAYIAYLEEYIRKWSYGQLHTSVEEFQTSIQNGGWKGYVEKDDGIYYRHNEK